jgi:hypothetical protein
MWFLVPEIHCADPVVAAATCPAGFHLAGGQPWVDGLFYEFVDFASHGIFFKVFAL